MLSNASPPRRCRAPCHAAPAQFLPTGRSLADETLLERIAAAASAGHGVRDRQPAWLRIRALLRVSAEVEPCVGHEGRSREGGGGHLIALGQQVVLRRLEAGQRDGAVVDRGAIEHDSEAEQLRVVSRYT